MHFASSKSFFSSDQLPLSGGGDSGTRMGCNPQQTEIRKTWWLIYWLLQEQTIPWPFLGYNSYSALTCCGSPAKHKTVRAPTAVPEVNLGLRCTKVCAAGDSWRPPHWPGEGDGPAGHLAAGQDTVPGLGHPPWAAPPSPGQRLKSQMCTAASSGESQHSGETH